MTILKKIGSLHFILLLATTIVNLLFLAALPCISKYCNVTYGAPVLHDTFLSAFFALPMTNEVNCIGCFHFVFYLLLCFFTFAATALFFTERFCFHKSQLHICFGFLCLFFAVYTSLPIRINPPILCYTMQDSAWFLMLLCIMAAIYPFVHKNISKTVRNFFIFFDLSFCILPLALLFFIFPVFPQSICFFSHFIEYGKIFLGCFLLFCSLSGISEKIYVLWLSLGNIIFCIGLLTNFLYANCCKSMLPYWQTQYSLFLLGLLFITLLLRCYADYLFHNQQVPVHTQVDMEQSIWHLEQLLSERKQFLSSVAHDLKAPISIIQTYIELLRTKNVMFDTDTAKYLDTIEKKALQIHNQIVNLQRFNLDESQSEPVVSIDLNQFLQQFFENTKPYADASGIYYQLYLPESTAFLLCQSNRLFRALENIVLNAVSFTPAGGIIRLQAKYQNQQATIDIEDTGQGILPENLSRIFDYRFSTQNDADDPIAGTHGLGLYFTKLTIDGLKGSISATSQRGAGTTLHICIPLHPTLKI